MSNYWRLIPPFAFAFLLAACATGANDSFSDSKLGYAPYSAAADADWANATTVEVSLGDFAFDPDNLSFELGHAYRLELENKSEDSHFFAAEDFFKAVVTSELVEDGATIEHPLLKAVALGPGQTKEVLFVPVRPGVYDLRCTVPFHRALGMSGTIRIS